MVMNKHAQAKNYMDRTTPPHWWISPSLSHDVIVSWVIPITIVVTVYFILRNFAINPKPRRDLLLSTTNTIRNRDKIFELRLGNGNHLCSIVELELFITFVFDKDFKQLLENSTVYDRACCGDCEMRTRLLGWFVDDGDALIRCPMSDALDDRSNNRQTSLSPGRSAGGLGGLRVLTRSHLGPVIEVDHVIRVSRQSKLTLLSTRSTSQWPRTLLTLWRPLLPSSECPDVKNCKWRFNPVWHRILYRCTTLSYVLAHHMATVGVKGFY